MPSLVALVNAISADVMAKMAAAGLPPLVDGGIVIGRAKNEETSGPPRIVFIPKTSSIEAKSAPLYSYPINPKNPLAPGTGVRYFQMTQEGQGYSNTPSVTLSAPDIAGGQQAMAFAVVTANGAISKVVPTVAGSGYLSAPTVTITDSTGTGAAAVANIQPHPQALTVAQQRAIFTERFSFDVVCWGVGSINGAAVSDPISDFDATQQLYHQVIASTHLVAPGVCTFPSIRWIDSQPASMAIDVLGRMAVLTLQINVAVLDAPMIPLTGLPVQYAPTSTQGNPTNSIIPFAGGSPEVGSSG